MKDKYFDKFLAVGIKQSMKAQSELRKLRKPKYTDLPKPQKPTLELHLQHVTVIMPK